MKKLVALLLVAVMCFALVACGSKKPVQSEIENFSEKTNVELTVEAVNALLASKEYAQKTAKYEDTFQQKVRTPKVTYVMEYHLDSFDGFALNLLLINLEIDYAVDDGAMDRTTLVVDLENGKWCDEVRSDFAKWQNSFDGVCKSVEDCYFIFLQNTFVEAGNSGSVFLNENESYSVFSDEELATVNAGLNVG